MYPVGYPIRKAGRNQGLFGYEGTMIDLAIAKDDAESILEFVRLGWIDAMTESLFGHRIDEHCVKKGAGKCASALRHHFGWK